MENILMYLEYGFPAVAIIALIVLFFIDRKAHPKIAGFSFFVALICILVPEIVNFYKKADKTVENLVNQNYSKITENSKNLENLKLEYKSVLDNTNTQISNLKSQYDELKESINKLEKKDLEVKDLKVQDQ